MTLIPTFPRKELATPQKWNDLSKHLPKSQLVQPRKKNKRGSNSVFNKTKRSNSSHFHYRFLKWWSFHLENKKNNLKQTQVFTSQSSSRSVFPFRSLLIEELPDLRPLRHQRPSRRRGRQRGELLLQPLQGLRADGVQLEVCHQLLHAALAVAPGQRCWSCRLIMESYVYICECMCVCVHIYIYCIYYIIYIYIYYIYIYTLYIYTLFIYIWLFDRFISIFSTTLPHVSSS